MSNHILIRLIKFVSRFTVYLCNTIYFLTIFNTSCKGFIKILYFMFWNLNKGWSSGLQSPGLTGRCHVRFCTPDFEVVLEIVASASPMMRSSPSRNHGDDIFASPKCRSICFSLTYCMVQTHLQCC